MTDHARRRTFITTTLTVFAGVSCFSSGMREALAQAWKVQKQVFTVANVNALFQSDLFGKTYAEMAARDLQTFVREHFYLTSAQGVYFDTLSQAKHDQIIRILDMYATNRYNDGRLVFTERFVPTPAPTPTPQHHNGWFDGPWPSIGDLLHPPHTRFIDLEYSGTVGALAAGERFHDES